MQIIDLTRQGAALPARHRPTRRGRRWLAAIAASMALSANAAWANSYSIVDLGADHLPAAINDRGRIPGTLEDASGSKGIVYNSQNTSEVKWKKLAGHGDVAVALGVSQQSDVAGAVGGVPVVWLKEKGSPLPIQMPDDFVQGEAVAAWSFQEPVDFHGVVAGDYVASDGRSHCFQTTDLGISNLFPSDGDFCKATGMNSQLHVVGGANQTPGGPTIAFVEMGSTVKFLGTLPGANPPYSIAMSTTVSHIVGCSNTADSRHAVLWKGHTMTDIGASDKFPGGTCANAINANATVIVGTGVDVDGVAHAVRFDGGAVIPLKSEVANSGKWELQNATGVNGDGVIVGDGILKGEHHGFMLLPAGAAESVR